MFTYIFIHEKKPAVNLEFHTVDFRHALGLRAHPLWIKEDFIL
jgi:hypothetical protein